MFVNKFEININTMYSGATANTITFSIPLNHSVIGQNELIESVFVSKKVEESINPILDYEKVRFSPVDKNLVKMDNIIYKVSFDGLTTYGDIGFLDDDIKFGKNNFKKSFLNLMFYDSDNPLKQNLITYTTLYPNITLNNLNTVGQTKPASEINVEFTISNPSTNKRGNYEGFYIYDYKDLLKQGQYKYLYMRSSFNNAKTGKSTNLMSDNNTYTIDNLIDKLYTRYKLIRENNGFYYVIDDTYNVGANKTNNVTYNNKSVTVNLFKIKVK